MAKRHHNPHGDYKRYMRVRCAFPDSGDAHPVLRRRPLPAHIIVKDLPLAVDENALKRIMSHFGNVDYVRIPVDKDTKERRGFGFVRLAVPPDADDDDVVVPFLAKAQRIAIDGALISVEKIKPKKYNGWIYRSSEDDGNKQELFHEKLGIGIVQTDIKGGLKGGYMWAIWKEDEGRTKAFLIETDEESTRHNKPVLFPSPASAKDWVTMNVMGLPGRPKRPARQDNKPAIIRPRRGQ